MTRKEELSVAVMKGLNVTQLNSGIGFPQAMPELNIRDVIGFHHQSILCATVAILELLVVTSFII